MCGICGQLNLSGEPVAQAVIESMMATIRHRGPDSQGLFVHGPVGLGHLRLSIIDLSDAGRQPMKSRDGSKWIIFNGEIYNYAELRRALELKGESFRSSSDTEVLLRLYERLGPACLEKLEGMFAFAVWDDSARTLFLARDRIGVKPLYYFLDDRALIFASEIKGILANPAVPRRVHLPGLFTYFTFGHSMAPDTMYAGIQKLLPGHYLFCANGATHITKYWDLHENAPLRLSEGKEAEIVCHLLDRAVCSHMVSDVPVGVFLSGGMDSSAVVAFMSRASTKPVNTFSIGFDVGGAFNELEDARKVARQFSSQHHEKIVTGLDVERLLERLVYHYDEPFADAANLPTFIVSEFARKQVKVALSGDGADEVFGGYRRYCAQVASLGFQKLPAFLRNAALEKLIPRQPRFRRLQKIFETMPIADDAMRYGTWLACFTEEEKAELFDPDFAALLQEHDVYWSHRLHYNRFPKWDTVNRILYTDLKTWLPDTYLEKLDKAAMACSLEGRVPFLDHRLVEYLFRLPGRWKVRGRSTKLLLKKSLEGTLPRALLHKPKHGFTVPLDEWFRGRLKGFLRDVLFDASPHAHAFLNRKRLDEMFEQHMSGERNYGTQLWTVLNFDLWYWQFMRPVCEPSPSAMIFGPASAPAVGDSGLARSEEAAAVTGLVSRPN
ncbi:MAG: asparagine synthase (glutamine-hydrolyzing) [Candidatus Acidiferrales bacterium]